MRSFSSVALALGCVLLSEVVPIQAAPLPVSALVVDTPHGPVRLEVEVASDDASRVRGLMYRTHLDPNAGMLFDFHDTEFRNFWMRNTLLPLDMIFIRADGTISSVAANTTPMSDRVISSQEPVRAVLEVNAGRASALGIRPGEKVHNPAFENAPAHQ